MIVLFSDVINHRNIAHIFFHRVLVDIEAQKKHTPAWRSIHPKAAIRLTTVGPRVEGESIVIEMMVLGGFRKFRIYKQL